MRNLIFLLILCCAAFANAQHDQSIVLEQDSITKFVIGADKMNILYKGIDNPISIAVSGEYSEDIQVTLSDGTISKVKGGYIARFKDSTRINRTEIRLFRVSEKGDTIEMGSQLFRVKDIPRPTPYVAQKTGYDSVSKTHLNAATKVFSRFENLGFDLQIPIVQYRVVIPDCGSAQFEEKVKGNRLSESFKLQLDEINSGDLVIFDDILVKMPSGYLASLNPIILKIE